MTSRPWMPLWIGDYRGKTAHLSCLEHGAYLLLIMHYWLTGGLPSDDKQLARIACCTLEEWNGIRGTVAAFFEPGWKHGRIEEELAKAERLSVQNSNAGKASAEARRQRALNARSTETQPSQSPSQSPSQLQPFSDSDRGNGVAKREERQPPRNGQTAPRVGRVYVTKGTPEWEAYAADYRSVHHREPDANKHGGKWFRTLGEGQPVVYRQEKTG